VTRRLGNFLPAEAYEGLAAMLLAIIIVIVILVVVVVAVRAMRKNTPGEPPVFGIIGWITSKMLGFAKGVLHLLGL
jgi:hypothetical protein